MNISKEASVLSGGFPDEAQLAKINTYSKSPLTQQEVYCFSVRLCDDLPDRDFERFDASALPILAELFLGKTGIADHDWSAERQIARIFDTEVCREPDTSYLKAWCYALRTEKNTDFIADIEGGIKKEVSIGCSISNVTCSICNSAYGSCEHRKGVTYDGTTCLAVLSQPTDAYEFSFVAVPAQKAAGVLKAKKGGVFMSLSELVEKCGDSALLSRLKALEQEAEFGRQCHCALLQETVSLAMLLDFGGDEALLRKAFSALDSCELRSLKDAMSKKSAALFPPAAQLPMVKSESLSLDTAYII